MMKQCNACQGLVPDGLTECPHCSATETLSGTNSRGSTSKLKPTMRRFSAIAAVGLISVTLQACYGAPDANWGCSSENAQDLDGDGVTACVYNGSGEVPWNLRYATPDGETQGDCDDNDASIFPGATDPVSDGLDQNCDGGDGVRGEEGFELMAQYYSCPEGNTEDKDGDLAYLCTADIPVWATDVVWVLRDWQDCNDTDNTVYPGAEDLSIDGIDQNCDGIDGSL